MKPPCVRAWVAVSAENKCDIAKHIPNVYPSTLYQYLADGVGNVYGKGAFRALTRGYIHRSSGHMNKLEINDNNPDYCFVRCQMRPSMKPGIYKVGLLLQWEPGDLASIVHATCECAAG